MSPKKAPQRLGKRPRGAPIDEEVNEDTHGVLVDAREKLLNQAGLVHQPGSPKKHGVWLVHVEAHQTLFGPIRWKRGNETRTARPIPAPIDAAGLDEMTVAMATICIKQGVWKNLRSPSRRTKTLKGLRETFLELIEGDRGYCACFLRQSAASPHTKKKWESCRNWSTLTTALARYSS